MCLLQPPLEYRDVTLIGRHSIQRDVWLRGFCGDENRIYCVEETQADFTSWLAVYDRGTAQDGSLSLLDKVKIGDGSWVGPPRSDSSHLVYVPCGRSGIRIFRCQDGRLLPARDSLRCVGNARSTDVSTADTVFVGDWDTASICLVKVSSDTVIRRLERPSRVWLYPRHVSVLGQTVLVCYGDNLLVYRSDSPTPGQLLQTPEGLRRVSSITTDSQSSSFLITDWISGSLYVLDDKLLWHRIYTGDPGLMGCAVVRSQLWLGYENGDIAVLTSR